MARIRTIKPEFYRDENLQDLEIANPGQHCMLVFSGLWGHCDINGTFLWSARSLHLDILPFIQFDFEKTLSLLREASLISQFISDGKTYGVVVNFTKHQRISGKEASEPAKFPSASQGSTGDRPVALGREKEREKEGKGSDGDQAEQELDQWVMQIASLYPKIDDAFHLPRDIAEEIAKAIIRHGHDVVWAGTKSVAEAVADWPRVERQFLPSAQKFFRESQYRKDPRDWERSSNGRPVKSSFEERAAEEMRIAREHATRTNCANAH
jgi:hypothetical protein